ncbi:MAG: lipopolysaccharide biosynthesis protein [Gammaproteobacteria bacterium]|nr:lipopolysaccharide biosynthesis protein [Gammaproteobacteria bacterium]MBU2478441.1 lipopolysaccharide biosynthesis protein [Gammaproteobacteria bacterium]
MNEEEQTKNLQDYIAAFWRRRAQITATFVVIFGIGLIVALALPPTYRSAATILIEEQQIPAELVQSTVTSYASQRIQTISQRVMTRSNLMEIIDKFDLYTKERKRDTTEEVLFQMRDDIKLDMISAEVVDPRTGRPTAATIAFSLAFQGEQPAQVQKVANELTTLYLQENIKTRASKAQETLTFLTDESNRLNQKIADLEKKLAEFKEVHAGNLPDLQDLVRSQIDRTERDLSDTATQIRSLEDRKFYLEGQLGQLEPYGQDVNLSPEARLKALRTQYTTTASRYSPDHPDVTRLKREIESLERETGNVSSRDTLLDQIASRNIELASVQDKYSDEHPDVVRIKREIAALEANLAKAPANSSSDQRRNPDNPAYITLQAQLNSTDNEIRSLQTKRTDLEKKRTEYEQRLTTMPQVEGEYRNIARDLQNASTQYQEINAKRMQAQIAQQLETESKGERFTLIEPPVLPEEPIKPNRPAIVFLSLVLALGAGLGYAAVAESLDSTVRGAKGVLATLQVAPLAVIPYLASDRETAAQRKHRRMLVYGAVAIVFTAVILVHFLVSPLDVLWFRALRKATKVTGIDLE